MDNKRRACMIESDEEDEDGNLSEGDSKHSSSESEPSMGNSDEEYDGGNLSEDSSKSSSTSSEDEEGHLPENNSKSKSARNKTSQGAEDDYLAEDSSSFQPEDHDETESFNNDNTAKPSRSRVKKTKPTGNKKNNKVSKRKRKSSTSEEESDNSTSSTDNFNKTNNKQVSKRRKKNVASGEDSDNSTTSSDSVSNTFNMQNAKFARQPTPLCDAILKEAASLKEACEQNGEETTENRPTRGLKSNNNKTLNSSDPNQMDLDEDPNSNDESKDLQIIDKIDPLLVKKEKDDIKFEINGDIKEDIDIINEVKEDIDIIDENKKDIKLFSTEENPTTDLVDVECQVIENKNVIQDSKLSQSNVQNKKKGAKRKIQEDISLSEKTKKQSTLPHTTINHQKEKPCFSSKAVSKSGDTKTATVLPRKRGRPPKYQALLSAEKSKEAENNQLSDLQISKENDTNNSAPKALSGPHKTQRRIVGPTTSVGSFNSNNDEPTAPRKRGRPSKAKVAESSQLSQKQTVQNIKGHLQLPENSPDSLVNSLLKTDNYDSPKINQSNIFDKNDLSCLQQLDNPDIYSQNIEMTAKEKDFFIAGYLNSHQSVFDSSFFQNILPVLTEVVMLCMDEFTELLAQNKKAENFTTEELRQQELKPAVQSFCSMVLTYSKKFFPNFNSVMYKINQNKTKKGLIIALIFFLANSLWVKAPKFKGQIHSMRKILLYMYEISQINSPLFFAVLTTPDNVFNVELKLLVKILLFLQENDVLAIPTSALPEISGNDSIEETCELIISSSTNCSRVNQELIKEEIFDRILCMLKQNHDVNSETSEKCNFESDCSHSLSQQDIGRVLAESLEQDQLGGGLNSLFESYLKSANIANVEVKTELDDEESDFSLNKDLRFPMPADKIDDLIKTEEGDCLKPEIDEQDPLSF